MRHGALLLLFMALSAAASAQTTVSGRVTGESGDPLAGAAVVVKGTSNGVLTDAEGMYRISGVRPADVLAVSYYGYEPFEAAVAGRSAIDFQLVPAANSLDEVVVVGYGTQRRSDLTGSITSVNAKDFASTPVYSVEQALQGRAAGVQVTQTSGAPGAGLRVQIRGVGTNGDTEPLYVIDGYPLASFSGGDFSTSPLARLNPNDIESIDILKDASAAAIYGARAANGVVIITTKRGKAGQTRVSYDGYAGFQQVWRTLDLLGERDYVEYVIEKYTNNNQAGDIPANLRDPSSLPGNNTDWQDELFRTGFLNNHNVTFSGGTESATFSLGLGYLANSGVMLGTDFERYTVSLNSDFKVGKRIRVGNSLNVAYTDKLSEANLGGRRQLEHVIKQPATIPVFSDDFLGGFGWPLDPDGQDAENPVAAATLLTSRSRGLALLGTVYGEVDLFKGLRYRINLGMNMGYNRGFSRNPAYEGVRRLLRFSFISESYNTSFDPLIEQTLTYARDFGKHSISLLAGLTDQYGQFHSLSGQAERLPNDVVQSIPLGQNPAVSNFTSDANLRSYLGRFTYSYDGKYLLTVNFRRDGSSKIPNPENRYDNFPSASLGWRLDREAFLQNVEAISNLKLRASYGAIGNDKSLGAYNNAVLNGFANYTFGGVLSPGTTPSSLVNTDIRWERSVQSNIGLDLGLFRDALILNVDYYIRRTQDWIVSVPVPPSVGLGPAPVNAGEIENRGLEVALTYRQYKSDKFSYNISANFATLHNEVISLGEGEPIFGGNTFSLGSLTRTAVGGPVGAYYGFEMEGIFQSQAEVDAANALGDAGPYQADQTAPGDIRFRDIAGAPDENGNPTGPDGKIDENDRTIIGSPIPDLIYGLTGSLAFGDFDLSLNLQGVHGNQLWNALRTWTEDLSQNFNQGAAVLDRWTPSNPSTTVPRAINTDPNNNKRNSSRFVENGSFMRIKNLTVGYSLRSLTGRIPSLNNARVYVTANNLLTLTRYTGYDPEVGGDNFTLGRGIDIGTYPQARTFLLGIQLGL
ncbi:MAG: TonB-dependent receptor [Bacteroidia bacterium]|nr:TonB-dependent receptor [Bacteroidia bacterium]